MTLSYSNSLKRVLLIAFIALLLLVLSVVLLMSKRSAEFTLPDFSAFGSVQEKKQQFFAYFRPLIAAENARIHDLRQEVLTTDTLDGSRFNGLLKKYRVSKVQSLEESRHTLLRRLDQIPVDLALSQAAIESAWGTSRFARDAYNFFGQWCFSLGCGLVPVARREGSIHEVRTFDSPEDSVHAYMLNLNSHPTYIELRERRAAARQAGRAVNGCDLALGLKNYSEKGIAYVNEIRQMIRVNHLGVHAPGSCDPVQSDDQPIERVESAS